MTTKHKRKEGELEFKLLLAATMPVFFVTTLTKRAMPWNWGQRQTLRFSKPRAARLTAQFRSPSCEG